ncbi:methylglyoxal synthase [[Clostridium] ultunense Esp]|uniref:Methylglyoxal synthase n=1 Tax=[Clostridium] ultunense Esp TaxID=1288971 RepID=M1ZGQ3_9FIRM|nr:methylglyoxal synthase [Schnuerera ultunensis]CCQ97624.1 methylglyoxal synthase [[Clostridium] ultunense Esp]SHD75752.1 methylglyoxal synthase [[Clostridium] ultunense Esp]
MSINKDFVSIKMGKQKRIALIAHDNRKKDMIQWVKTNRDKLSQHFLCGTGTTATLIAEATNLPVKAFKSGPLGGDQQIGSRIAEGDIDFMIFFWDPLEAQPHDPDVKALLRIAVLYDIPVANNQSTADFLLSSPLMEEEYIRKLVDFSKGMVDRVKGFKVD